MIYYVVYSKKARVEVFSTFDREQLDWFMEWQDIDLYEVKTFNLSKTL